MWELGALMYAKVDTKIWCPKYELKSCMICGVCCFLLVGQDFCLPSSSGCATMRETLQTQEHKGNLTASESSLSTWLGEDPQYQSITAVWFSFVNFINIYRERETEREIDWLYDVKYKIPTYSENQEANSYIHPLEWCADWPCLVLE